MNRSSRSGTTERADAPLARLSRPPERRWPDGVVHHGSRFALLFLLALAVSLFFPPSPGMDMGRYQVGMVADEDIIAAVTFGVPKNPDELDRERASAAAAVPPTFEYREEAVIAMEAALDVFFRNAGEAMDADDPDEALGDLLASLGFAATPAQRSTLASQQSRTQIREAGLRAVRTILPRGVLDDATRLEVATTGRIQVIDPDGTERFVPRDSVLAVRDFYEQASGLLVPGAPGEVDELLRLILIRFMDPTLRYDPVTTAADRDAARQAVPTTRATVLQGEAIVRAAQQISEGDVERLQAYEEALRAQGLIEDAGFRPVPFSGSILLNLLILGIFGGLLYLFRSDVYHNFRWVLLQGLLVLAFTGAAGVIARNQLPPEALPIAFVALATAVLWDGRLALILVAVLAALAGTQIPFQSVDAWLPVMVGGAAAALSVRAVRRRAQTWIFIAIIAGAYFAVIAALGAVTGAEASRVLESWAWAGGNAVVSSILAMGFLPVFEWFTRITTDQTLLEWADPNRPLLKRLSMEAPGTYAHTINVANLSEAAANAIGANGLLSRVGVYYHDVGKMLKPQYFIENQPTGRNPHDKLKPATSAAIVREHVTEGLRLAREAKLPDVLLDFIPEHHGTQEISFFIERARSEGTDEDELDPQEYQYPGPKPQSKETAIVMLADSVESATRTLQDPTPDRVKELIDSIVDGKIQQGQLDEAPLTLREIGVIREQFLKVLGGLYHHRIDYPATRHLTEAPGPEAAGPEASTEGETPAEHTSPREEETEPALFPLEGRGDD